MPSNPFGKKDPLGGTQSSGAWGAGPAGFGSAYADSAAHTEEEYDVVDMSNDPPAGQSAGHAPSSKFKSSRAGRNGSTAPRSEAELRKWQADLEERERAAGSQRPLPLDAIKNFPPCLPIAHHNISKDIPAGKKSITRMAFLIWLFTLIALLYGCVAIIICNIISSAVKTSAPNIVWAIMVVIIGVPVSWLLWYKRFYKGMINDGAFSFCVFFCVFLVHIAWCIFAAVSPPIGSNLTAGANTYTTGFMNTIEFSQNSDSGKDKLAVILCAVGASWWAVVALVSFIFLIRSYKYFRGHSVDEEARKDTTNGA